MTRQLTILTAAVMLCGGCIPIPHTTTRFPQMDGRVVDANSHTPIASATVAIHDHSRSYVKTDAQGRFHIPRQKNFSFGYDLNFVCGPDDIGGNKYYSSDIDVSATNYVTQKVSAPRHFTSCDTNTGALILKDILLEPTSEKK